METLPYHHLPDGTFRNLPGSPKRKAYKRSEGFFSFLYKGLVKREMFGQKEIPDNIPKKHFIMEEEALTLLNNNKAEISITWLGHASFLIRLGNKNFVKRAPKFIVDQEKTNYNNLKSNVKKILITIKNL